MSESLFRSFAESGLSAKYRAAYALARESHQLKQQKFDSGVFHYHYHPVAMANGLIKLGFSSQVVQAGMLHDVVEFTPMTFDHLERVVEHDVQMMVYEQSIPEDFADLKGNDLVDAYGKFLLRASPEAQSIKLLDLILTSTALGGKESDKAVQHAMYFEQLLPCLGQADKRLLTRAEFVIKWAKRRAYENQVDHYEIPFKTCSKRNTSHPA